MPSRKARLIKIFRLTIWRKCEFGMALNKNIELIKRRNGILKYLPFHKILIAILKFTTRLAPLTIYSVKLPKLKGLKIITKF